MLHRTPKDDIVDFAAQWVGVNEVGSNDGWDDEAFTALMKQAGWLKDEPWCASFVKMIWANVYQGENFHGKLLKTLSKSVMKTYQNAKDASWLTVQNLPTVGGIVLWSTGRGRGHTGIVEEVLDDYTVRTIEGNTNRAGSREGDKVMRKRRKLQPTAKHLKWHYLGTIVPPDYGTYITEDLQ